MTRKMAEEKLQFPTIICRSFLQLFAAVMFSAAVFSAVPAVMVVSVVAAPDIRIEV